MVITLDEVIQKFVGWTPDAPDDGFPIDGASGYIVNVPHSNLVVFVGTGWSNHPGAAPGATSGNDAWAFVLAANWRVIEPLTAIWSACETHVPTPS